MVTRIVLLVFEFVFLFVQDGMVTWVFAAV